MWRLSAFPYAFEAESVAEWELPHSPPNLHNRWIIDVEEFVLQIARDWIDSASCFSLMQAQQTQPLEAFITENLVCSHRVDVCERSRVYL